VNSCGNDTLESSRTTRPSHIPHSCGGKKNDNFKQKLFNFNFDECVTYMPGTFCYRHPRSHKD
jgi:hypothetical protein